MGTATAATNWVGVGGETPSIHTVSLSKPAFGLGVGYAAALPGARPLTQEERKRAKRPKGICEDRPVRKDEALMMMTSLHEALIK